MEQPQLSYVLVTPHTIRKSRTGPILSRLISRSGLDLVGARMFAPSKELAEAYAATVINDDPNPRHRATQLLIREYIVSQIGPDADGRRRRCLLLVFRGPDAVARLMNTVGHIVHERTSAETIRDTYGDYVVNGRGRVHLFRAGRARRARPQPRCSATCSSGRRTRTPTAGCWKTSSRFLPKRRSRRRSCSSSRTTSASPTPAPAA